MPFKISINQEQLNLPTGFSTEIEEKSPIFNEEGSQSIATTIPSSAHNLQITGFIHRTDINQKPLQNQRASVSDGVYHRTGKLNIVSASKSEGITFNIGFAESELYRIWNAVSLQSLKLPTYTPEAPDPTRPSSPVARLCSELLSPTRDPNLPFEIFQVVLSINIEEEDAPKPTSRSFIFPDKESDKVSKTYLEIINKSWQARTETVIVNGEKLEIELPEGYGCTPFLKVSYILERIFQAYGYKVVENPFATHHQLSRLVVLNNAVDACVKGTLRYADLMPGCTINEFMQALWCRFGLLFFVNSNTKEVRLKFIRDILNEPHTEDWTSLKAAWPTIHYEEPRQLKLSAATNVSGPSSHYTARVPTENFDLFLDPYHHMVSQKKGATLRYDPLHGAFYRKDLATNGEEFAAYMFFPWDKKHDLAYKEITSIDECLPTATITIKSPENRRTNQPEEKFFGPLYLFGKVHRYTTITSSDVELSNNVQTRTPLAFCFAFSGTHINGNQDFGSQFCQNQEGNPFTDAQGRQHDISLSFVGQYGLFNHFWREYDAMLRHAGHIIETELRLSTNKQMNPDFSKPILFDGQRVLPDLIHYKLPFKKSEPTTVRLRTLKLLKPFNLAKEQTVPITEQLYTWVTFNNKEELIPAAVAEKLATYTQSVRGYLNNPNVQLSYKVITKEELIPKKNFPYAVPSEQDVTQHTEYLLCRVPYKFSLSYDITDYSLYTTGGRYNTNLRTFLQNLGKDDEFNIEYDIRIRATTFQ